MMSVTTLIIAITCIASFLGFSNQKLVDDLIFYPPAITNRNQWYRFFTCGFIHADVPHLAFNMLSLYMLGNETEMLFQVIFKESGKFFYLLMYVSSLFFCLVPIYFKNKDNYHYRSLGASGAVSAVVFAFIFIEPTRGLGLMIIPGVYPPAFVFGFLYLGVSAYMAKKGNSNINHSAHLWGAVYGIIFLAITSFAFTDYNLLSSFIHQVQDKIKSYTR
ncbi:MAG: rhomboid family intramembrane serine protease [Chitinophagaceae bacterium]